MTRFREPRVAAPSLTGIISGSDPFRPRSLPPSLHQCSAAPQKPDDKHLKTSSSSGASVSTGQTYRLPGRPKTMRTTMPGPSSHHHLLPNRASLNLGLSKMLSTSQLFSPTTLVPPPYFTHLQPSKTPPTTARTTPAQICTTTTPSASFVPPSSSLSKTSSTMSRATLFSKPPTMTLALTSPPAILFAPHQLPPPPLGLLRPLARDSMVPRSPTPSPTSTRMSP